MFQRGSFGDLGYRRFPGNPTRSISPDLITTVPPSNELRRNQPLPAIAKGISERLACPYRADALVKVRQTEELKTIFDGERRRELLQGVFRPVPAIMEGRKVLLLDDLFRSGATLTEAAREILENGRAKSVAAITLTKTLPPPPSPASPSPRLG